MKIEHLPYYLFYMKLACVFLGLLGFLLGKGLCLGKTESEAQAFLVDGGHVNSNATVETFSIDRQGKIRIGLLENGMRLSYGLEEDGDTLSIAYMSKKKDRRPKKKTEEEKHEQLTKLLSENICFL